MKIIKEYNTFINERQNYYEPTTKKFSGLGRKVRGINRAVKQFFKGEVSEKEALDIIKSHPTKRRLYQNLLKTNPEKAEKLLQFIMKNPNVTYFTWNVAENDFTSTEVSSMRENMKNEK